ncbi:MAG: AmmeMemoRadiSam system radical SAM enzyme [Rubrivivax sp.]|nr:AmmeMemoRadiSam system radical SAM enzyme [Rubrivivax sp.]
MTDDAAGDVPVGFWHAIEGGKIQCDLCPRYCHLSDGQRGLCFVRARKGDGMVLTSYGRSSGFCIDPIEKKPLNHYYPGTPVLSFGTAGCNLACKFCQNWDISKSRDIDALAAMASPEKIASTALELGCEQIAFTYNDPVIFLEYARDTAAACREAGIRTVAVTAGYICPEPRAQFFQFIDATNIDLKAFDAAFYHRICGGRLDAVLETIAYVHRETDVWMELTTLLIPGHNDSEAEIARLAEWVLTELGPDVPLHFSAFHPDWKMRDVPPTPPATLRRARAQAMAAGLNYVYTGNVHDRDGDTTWCAACGTALIERDWYDITGWRLGHAGACRRCGARLPGHFRDQPGTWGRRRQFVPMPAAGRATAADP